MRAPPREAPHLNEGVAFLAERREEAGRDNREIERANTMLTKLQLIFLEVLVSKNEEKQGLPRGSE